MQHPIRSHNATHSQITYGWFAYDTVPGGGTRCRNGLAFWRTRLAVHGCEGGGAAGVVGADDAEIGTDMIECIDVNRIRLDRMEQMVSAGIVLRMK